MDVYFYTSDKWGFEQWDYRSPEHPGIGGSETAQVEMSWRMARRGHRVTCYTNLTPGVHPEWRGTVWLHSREARFDAPGLWVLSRCPEVLDNFGPRRPDQPRYLVCQDTEYPDALTPERAEKLDIIFGLCPTHVALLQQRYPFLADKVRLSGNGIRSDSIRELLHDPPPRNLKRLIWTSSPDRGLDTLLHIFQRAREVVPDLELHCFYGWDNIDKIIAAHPTSWWASFKAGVVRQLQGPNVFWHGRTGQFALYAELLQSALWVYPTTFSETSCIAIMDAQACGVIPITNPYWALAHNGDHGVYLEGDPKQDLLTRMSYVGEIIRLTRNPDLQAQIRERMQLGALMAFNWENVVSQYEMLMLGYVSPSVNSQHNFQAKHAQGKILNVGSAGDPSGLAARGATNLDLFAVDMLSGMHNPVDIIADCRSYSPDPVYDSIVIGDVFTHMNHLDVLQALQHLRSGLHNGGQFVVTMSEDNRPEPIAHGTDPTREYAPGQSLLPRCRTLGELRALWTAAGLTETHYELLDYGFCGGHGFVLKEHV